MTLSPTTEESARALDDSLEGLAKLIRDRRPWFVLTGAGCSTASGIPDYRDSEGNWKRGQPIRYQDFLRSLAARRRYWARSFIGWPRIAGARPNATHRRLADLEAAGYLHQLVTQNVDGLHQLAGHRRVIDLHGRLSCVDCLGCRRRFARWEMQERLADANQHFHEAAGGPAPDGDALLDAAAERGFRVPDCPTCGGLLKPAVVFFGENVPRARVERAFQRLGEAGALLVVGSSLTVYSGYRFCRQAALLGLPLVLVNRGKTRADELAAIKLQGDAGGILGVLSQQLGLAGEAAGAARGGESASLLGR